MAQHRNAYQEIDHYTMFGPVTKYNVIVETIEQLPYLLRQAFREATSGAPGPVHLDVIGAEGEVTALAEADLEVMVEDVFTHYPSIRPEPDMASVREAARVIEDAERPVIVAGGGAMASGAGPDIVGLAEMLSIPVATSLNGKGTIVETHPLSVGVVGSYSRWCANQVVSEADLVIFIGSHTGDQVTNAWTVPKPGTPVIQIDIDPLELGRSYPNRVGLMADAKVAVRRLIESIDRRFNKNEWAQKAQQCVQKWREEIKPSRDSNAIPILPERLCKEMTDFLPSNAILVSDTGFASVWAGTMVYLTYPDQLSIRSAGSLGWAFPASLGAKCGDPERPVVCFTGDGGFWYHLTELETASRRNIKTITVVNNNSCFKQCMRGVNRAYGDDSGSREDMYQFRDTDFAKIAQDMGCFGIRVERPEELPKAFKKALEADVAAVVDVVTDPEHDAPWPPPAICKPG
jgi:acetolactate synthase-1/2/3 large subunit